MECGEYLKRHPFFETFSAEALARICQDSELVTCAADQRLITYGTPVVELGVIIDGACAVLVPDVDRPATRRRQVATLGARDMFGEMSLLTGEPATADVVAEAGARVVLMPHATLSRELASNPVGIRFLGRLLTVRLRERSADESAELAVEQARRDERRSRSMVRPAPGRATRILVLNAGSSSLKYDFFDSSRPTERMRGLVERIGEKGARHRFQVAGAERTEETEVADHEAALALCVRRLTDPETGALRPGELTAVGHRIVHGGARFSAPTVIEDDVLAEIESLSRLAPLHNPVGAAGVRAARKLLPGVPQVAVFDTAFHATMPDYAATYAIPRALAEKHGLRRYGFHGTSHKYVAQRAAAFLERASRDLKLITCHLGNGASVCAIDHGRAVDTSMGLTPLEGLVMGTRSGDVDPGLVLHLSTALGMSPAEVDRLLNRESGLLGISGVSKDMRELRAAADGGDPHAQLAIAVFCYRVKKYIGSYIAVLGGLDALVFTGGIGEGSAGVRARVCQGLAGMGLVLDEAQNAAPVADPRAVRAVSTSSSPVPVLVVPTDEESMIAHETMTALGLHEVTSVVRRIQDLPIPVNVSAHHLHLAQPDVEALFGPGHQLTRRSDLLQPGQFACEETVALVGPRGTIERVRVLGPTRKQSQVEISRTEEFKLGIDAPIRASGDLKGSPGLTLRGTAGEVKLTEGTICALRHIHIDPDSALHYTLRDRDVVRIRIPGERSLTFGDVLVRVSPDFKLEMHIDTDEANAAELNQGAVGYLDGIQARRA